MATFDQVTVKPNPNENPPEDVGFQIDPTNMEYVIAGGGNGSGGTRQFLSPASPDFIAERYWPGKAICGSWPGESRQ